jgi:LuxR family maltose regulon positive regulatory protein
MIFINASESVTHPKVYEPEQCALNRPIVGSKLSPPRRAEFTIDQPRLALNERSNSTAPVVLVYAPAGYGKTTLLTSWRASLRQDTLVMWLTLDEQDRDTAGFLACLVAAAKTAGIAIGQFDATLQRQVPLEAQTGVILGLTARLEEISRRVVIFLDDYDRAESRSVNNLVELLIKRIPPNCQLIIGSRSRPNISLSQLKVTNALLEFCYKDLRFSTDEVQRFINATSSTLEASELSSATEGWPLAVALCVIPSRGSQKKHDNIKHCTGRAEGLVAYFAEQVLNGLPQRLKRFLEDISILDTFNGDLANHVCGARDSWTMIDHLQMRNLFIFPLDDELQWFRIHRMFAEFLLERARRRDSRRLCELHRRAAEWLAANDYLHEAVRHAAKTAEPLYAMQLVEAAGGWRLAVRGGLSVLRAFTEFRELNAAAFPRIKLAQVYLAAQEGSVELARREMERLRAATHDFRADPAGKTSSALWAESRVVDFWLNYYEDRQPQENYLQELGRVFAEMPEVEPCLRLVMDYSIRTTSCFTASNFEECRRISEKGISACGEAGQSYAETYLYVFLGLACLEQGKLRCAKNAFLTMHALAEKRFGKQSNLGPIATMLLAAVLYEEGQLDAAASSLGESLDRVERGDGFYDILSYGYLTALALAQRSPVPGAIEGVLQRAGATAQRRNLARLAQLVGFLEFRGRPCDKAQRMLEGQVIGLFNDGASHGSTLRLRILGAVALAERYIKSGNYRNGLRIVDNLRPILVKFDFGMLLVKATALEALALFRSYRTERACWRIKEALQYGVQHGFRMSIADAVGEEPGLLRHVSGLGGFLSAAEAEVLADVRRLAGNARASRLASFCSRDVDFLTDRENQVLAGLRDGYSNKEIAYRLGISDSTVKVHRKSLYRKLGASSRSQVLGRGRELRTSLAEPQCLDGYESLRAISSPLMHIPEASDA